METLKYLLSWLIHERVILTFLICLFVWAIMIMIKWNVNSDYTLAVFAIVNNLTGAFLRGIIGHVEPK